jgi:hypothetical protein
VSLPAKMCSFEKNEDNKKDILKNNIPVKMVIMIGKELLAKPSIEDFFKEIKGIKELFGSSDEFPEDWDELCTRGVALKCVDLKCDGRKSCYDLTWFPSTNKIYAMDSSDDDYVYEVKQ